jgi:hyperosmotically inducible periplasmic protein
MRRLLSAFVVLTMVAGSALVAGAADTKVGKMAEDTAIHSKVKAKLTAESAKNLVKVNVDVKDGVVHLKGTVPTEADKAEAERLARATDGVKEVMNELTVSSSPSASPGTKK